MTTDRTDDGATAAEVTRLAKTSGELPDPSLMSWTARIVKARDEFMARKRSGPVTIVFRRPP